MSEPRGWHSRGYLPHIDAENTYQFLTWHLADSLPIELATKWRADLQHLDDHQRQRQYYRRLEKHLDLGFGSQLLKNLVVAKIVQDSLIFGHGERYALSAWSVMPTHVHCILRCNPGWTLSEIVQGIKGFTAHQINKKLGRTGQLWQEDYFDRMIRNEKHFHRTLKYIEWNAVKAKLCTDPTHWIHCSANPIAKNLLLSKNSLTT